MLADEADHLIGVDTHRDTHTAVAAEAKSGQLGAALTVSADRRGYERLCSWAGREAPGRRAWAIEATSGYGAGLAAYLSERGERVVEVDRPKRPARRSGAKSDELDAARAAREALASKHPTEPRRRGEREAVRVLLRTRGGAVKARTQASSQLQALRVTAPEALRARLRGLSGRQLVRRCARLRIGPGGSSEERATMIAMRSAARRAEALEAESAELESELWPLLRRICPTLVAEPGVGLRSAAELLNAWSHPGRLRSEAAFAMLGGVAPIPASSGQIVRHRLNRSGDRQLNRALHTIVVSRMRCHPQTRAYVERRRAEGKTPKEMKRCLKRYVARHLFRLLEAEVAMS